MRGWLFRLLSSQKAVWLLTICYFGGCPLTFILTQDEDRSCTEYIEVPPPCTRVSLIYHRIICTASKILDTQNDTILWCIHPFWHILIGILASVNWASFTRSLIITLLLRTFQVLLLSEISKSMRKCCVITLCSAFVQGRAYGRWPLFLHIWCIMNSWWGLYL